MKNQVGHTFTMPKGKTYYIPCLLLSILFVFGFGIAFLFIPDFWFHDPLNLGNGDRSFFFAFNERFITNPAAPAWQHGLGWFHWAIFILAFAWTPMGAFLGFREIFNIFTLRKWWSTYIGGCTEIINSCKDTTINGKVAMVVCTCNDILPNTIFQTAQQSYKNMDVWISDDSNKPEIVQQIDKFAAEHGYHVLHRDPSHKKAHPTKIGNLYYFIEKYGNNYEYIFENDSSTITTPHFVENALYLLNTPLFNHENDGGVIAQGSFMGIKSLLPYLYSTASQLAEATVMVGGTTQISGHPAQMNGWGALYRTSLLKKIPLEDVECPSCDMTRGFWLTARGYHNYLNPFDFSSKLCPPNAEGIKNQWLKWTGGDVFSMRKKLSVGNFPDRNLKIFVWLTTCTNVFILPITCLLAFVYTVVFACLNFFYLNFTSIIFMAIIALAWAILFLVLIFKTKTSLKVFILWALFYGGVGVSILYKKALTTIKDAITKKWSSGAVTVKGVSRTNWKQKLKTCRFDLIIILLALTLCTVLTVTLTNAQLSRFIIWFNIFIVISGPSFLYILWVWIGEIRVKKGWDTPMLQYMFWLNDFRYDYIKDTEVWKKQNN